METTPQNSARSQSIQGIAYKGTLSYDIKSFYQSMDLDYLEENPTTCTMEIIDPSCEQCALNNESPHLQFLETEFFQQITDDKPFSPIMSEDDLTSPIDLTIQWASDHESEMDELRRAFAAYLIDFIRLYAEEDDEDIDFFTAQFQSDHFKYHFDEDVFWKHDEFISNELETSLNCSNMDQVMDSFDHIVEGSFNDPNLSKIFRDALNSIALGEFKDSLQTRMDNPPLEYK